MTPAVNCSIATGSAEPMYATEIISMGARQLNPESSIQVVSSPTIRLALILRNVYCSAWRVWIHVNGTPVWV